MAESAAKMALRGELLSENQIKKGHRNHEADIWEQLKIFKAELTVDLEHEEDIAHIMDMVSITECWMDYHGKVMAKLKKLKEGNRAKVRDLETKIRVEKELRDTIAAKDKEIEVLRQRIEVLELENSSSIHGGE